MIPVRGGSSCVPKTPRGIGRSPVRYMWHPESPPPADTVMALLEISNHERFIHLRRDYFAHVIVTAGVAQQLQHVDLLRDGSIVRRFSAVDGSQLHEQRIPVTQMPGTYGPGWIWHTEERSASTSAS